MDLLVIRCSVRQAHFRSAEDDFILVLAINTHLQIPNKNRRSSKTRRSSTRVHCGKNNDMDLLVIRCSVRQAHFRRLRECSIAVEFLLLS
jgi:menaquinone-dependent protoporphyrinogen IX oxidase